MWYIPQPLHLLHAVPVTLVNVTGHDAEEDAEGVQITEGHGCNILFE